MAARIGHCEELSSIVTHRFQASSNKIEIVHMEKTMFKWTIPNFERLDNPNGTRVQSEPFNIGLYKWYLSLYPNGAYEDEEDSVSLFLNLDDRPIGPNLKTNINLCILNRDNMILHTKFHARSLVDYFRHGHGSRKFILRSDILDRKKEYYTENVLFIGVEVTTIKNDRPIQMDNNAGNLLKYFNEEDLSDFKIIKANNETIHAHKILLAANSPYFAGMFKSGMKEASDRQVSIVDIPPEVLSETVKFIYSGTIEISENGGMPPDIEFMQELLKAANKFMMLPLKAICEQNLSNNLSNENAIQLLEFAETYTSSELKQAAVDYIKMHKKVLVGNDEWNTFFQRNADLAHEVLLELLNVKKRKAEEMDE